MEYLTGKIGELETNSVMKNIRFLYRGINNFIKCSQPRSNRVKDEKGDLVTDSHNVLARLMKHFFQLFHVHGFSNVKQTEVHSAEPLVPQLRAFEFVMAIEELKQHK
jgi:hypothetical protein